MKLYYHDYIGFIIKSTSPVYDPNIPSAQSNLFLTIVSITLD